MTEVYPQITSETIVNNMNAVIATVYPYSLQQTKELGRAPLAWRERQEPGASAPHFYYQYLRDPNAIASLRAPLEVPERDELLLTDELGIYPDRKIELTEYAPELEDVSYMRTVILMRDGNEGFVHLTQSKDFGTGLPTEVWSGELSDHLEKSQKVAKYVLERLNGLSYAALDLQENFNKQRGLDTLANSPLVLGSVTTRSLIAEIEKAKYHETFQYLRQ